jgi:hypothetical protein
LDANGIAAQVNGAMPFTVFFGLFVVFKVPVKKYLK